MMNRDVLQTAKRVILRHGPSTSNEIRRISGFKYSNHQIGATLKDADEIEKIGIEKDNINSKPFPVWDISDGDSNGR